MSHSPHWPFETAEEFSAWKSLSDRGYAALREAHEQWMQAFDKSKSGNESDTPQL